MAGRDHSLALRKAIVVSLRGDAQVAVEVGSRVYDYVPSPIVWPYIRYGVDIVSAFEGTGIAPGGEIDVTLHVFAKGTGSDTTKRLMNAIIAALDERELTLNDGFLVDIAYTDSRLIDDQDEPGASHGIIRFNALTAG